MKKCNRCNGVYQDKYVMCPNCNVILFDADKDAKPKPPQYFNASNEPRVETKKNLDNFNNPVTCPKCGSQQITVQKRGWTWTTAFIGMNKNKRVCMNCLYKW